MRIGNGVVVAVTAALFFVGCASGQNANEGGDDGAGGGDASTAVDASVHADGSSGVDATAPGDASNPDATAGDDGALADAATLDGAAIDANDDDASQPTGLNWPPGQVFPSFPPVGPLDVVSSGGLANDTLSLVTTLEGLVNRTKPRIFVSDGSAASSLWLTEIGAATTSVADPLSLVTKYRAEIAGIVIDDDTVADTLNLATTIAGLKGGIVASPALSTTLTAAPYSLPVLADLRTNHFTSTLDVYQYELDNYAPLCTHRLIVGLTPTIVDHLRDYVVATQAMMVWLDPTNAQQAAMLDQYLALLAPNAPYMGWWTSEPDGVHQAATHGVPVYAADWSLNLTVLGGTPRGSNPPKAPPPPKLEKKVYVSIFMSDGDNLQEDEGLIPLKWSDAKRGDVPMSWTVSPALVDVAPVILRYYQRTGTLNDQLVSGPSGLGYTYPAAWPSTATFDSYTKVSAGYLQTAGLRSATVWNNGADLSAANAQSYATNIPSLLGLTIQDSTTAIEWVNGTLPIQRMTVSYGSNESDLESGVDSVVSSFDGTKPIFAAVQGDMNQGTIDPTAFDDVRNHYDGNTNVVFVRSDHLFQLMAQANAPAQHQVFSGDFDGDGKTDSAFYYGGNGDFWLGISNGKTLTFTNAGNQAGFGNLLDGSHAFYTGDFNGDGKTDLAFVYPGDGSWWLGASTGSAFAWTKLSTTTFGSVLDGKHAVRVGDYDGDGKSDFAVYASSDGSWQIGRSTGTSLTWSAAGSTSGFGNLLDGAHAFYDGDFDGDGKSDVLFYYTGDQNLWLGHSTGTTFTWAQLGNTTNFGDVVDHAHRLMAADFDGDKKTDLLFQYSGDGNWWLGKSSGTSLAWSNVSTTTTPYLDLDHHLFVADADGDGRADVFSYDSGSGDWVVGHSTATPLTWTTAANAATATYGDLGDPSHLVWLGDYDGDGKKEPLFYSASDGSWWIGHSNGTTFTWAQAASTPGFGDLTR